MSYKIPAEHCNEHGNEIVALVCTGRIIEIVPCERPGDFLAKPTSGDEYLSATEQREFRKTIRQRRLEAGRSKKAVSFVTVKA